MAKELDQAFQIQKLFQKFFEEVDPKMHHQEKLASVTAQMDERFGPEWRKKANPDGVKLMEIVEGGRSEKSCKDHEKAFFDKISKAMLEKRMENGKLIDITDLDEPVVKPQRSIMDKISIHIERSA